MKKVLLVSSLVVLMASCSKSNDAPAAVDPLNTINSGQWTVGSLTQRGEDKTSQLQGYTFTFAAAGVLKMEKAGVSSNGSWAYTPAAVTYYGSTPSKANIFLNAGADKPLSQISRSWNVDSLATTSTKLALVSPEVVEDMHLTFNKK